MRNSRFSEEQIIVVLNAAQAGQKVADLCRTPNIVKGRAPRPQTAT